MSFTLDIRKLTTAKECEKALADLAIVINEAEDEASLQELTKYSRMINEKKNLILSVSPSSSSSVSFSATAVSPPSSTISHSTFTNNDSFSSAKSITIVPFNPEKDNLSHYMLDFRFRMREAGVKAETQWSHFITQCIPRDCSVDFAIKKLAQDPSWDSLSALDKFEKVQTSCRDELPQASFIFKALEWSWEGDDAKLNIIRFQQNIAKTNISVFGFEEKNIFPWYIAMFMRKAPEEYKTLMGDIYGNNITWNKFLDKLNEAQITLSATQEKSAFLTKSNKAKTSPTSHSSSSLRPMHFKQTIKQLKTKAGIPDDVCYFFATKGKCKDGTACSFKHVSPSGSGRPTDESKRS